MTPLNRSNEYVSNRVLTASPVELIRIMYEAAVQAVDQALAALRSGDILVRGRSVSKAIDILSELRISLRRDVQEQYSNTLAELYGYIQHQLMRAHSEQSESLLREASHLLNTLLEGWVGTIEKVDADPNGRMAGGHEVNGWNPYSAEPPGSSQESRSWQL